MNKLFGPDSLFFKYGTIFADLVILTIIWSLVSLPVVTMGAATTAMYYVTTRQLSAREGYVTRDFFRSFKQNFVTATLLTIMFLFFAVLLFFNITSAYGTVFFYLSIVVAYEVVATAMYAFPILARFDLKFFGVLRNAFFMANRHIFTTLSCFVVLAALLLVTYKFPFLFVVCIGLYCFVTSIFFMTVFRKYVPDMDKDEEE